MKQFKCDPIKENNIRNSMVINAIKKINKKAINKTKNSRNKQAKSYMELNYKLSSSNINLNQSRNSSIKCLKKSPDQNQASN